MQKKSKVAHSVPIGQLWTEELLGRRSYQYCIFSLLLVFFRSLSIVSLDNRLVIMSKYEYPLF